MEKHKKKTLKYSCKMIPDWEMVVHLGNFFRNIKPHLLPVKQEDISLAETINK